MKKIIAIVFAILTITSLTSCGNKATTNGNDYKPSIDDTIVEETPTYNVIDELDKTTKMVVAWYKERAGIYTLEEALALKLSIIREFKLNK